MSDYQRQSLHASAVTLLAAALAYVASFVHAPGPDVAAVLGIGAVLLLAAYYFLDRPDRLAGAWTVPTVAAVVVVASDRAADQRLAALALAALSVVGFVTFPVTARAAELGERVGEKLR